MLANKQAEEAIVSDETEHEANREDIKEIDDTSILSLKSFLWHGGSAWDAWFSCASNQVAQVLLTLPYSFSQLGFLSGILFQIFYGLVGSWTTYLINVLYLEYRSRKGKENVSFQNHVIQVDGVKHLAPQKLELYFTGATNILYTFGGHVVTVRGMLYYYRKQNSKPSGSGSQLAGQMNSSELSSGLLSRWLYSHYHDGMHDEKSVAHTVNLLTSTIKVDAD